MSYQSIVEMASSQTLLSRIVAAAAEQGSSNPLQWGRDNIWAVVSNSEWSNAWAYAKDTYTDDNNPDTGARPGVINDSMILSAVQTLMAEQAEPPA